MSAIPHQLCFDFDAAPADGNGVAARLKRRDKVPQGPERLLMALVRRGLAEDHLTTAAALCLALDREADGPS
jgi:hypothetical protein